MTYSIINKINTPYNLSYAWRLVKKKGGKPGIDNISVEEISNNTSYYLLSIQELIKHDMYQPRRLKEARILKPNGTYRVIHIPSIIDRIVGRAILNIISPTTECTFAENSYAFQHSKSIFKAIEYVNNLKNSGFNWYAKLDIKSYFDSIDHVLLENVLRARYKDKIIIRLLLKFVQNSENPTNEIGIPQGAVLSPLFSNLYLDDLDKMSIAKNLRYVRYADDILLMGKSEEQVIYDKSVIENELTKKKLIINKEKSTVSCFKHNNLVFLGYNYKDNCLSIPEESIKEFKEKIIKITSNKELKSIIFGWKNFYKLVNDKIIQKEIKQWLVNELNHKKDNTK